MVVAEGTTDSSTTPAHEDSSSYFLKFIISGYLLYHDAAKLSLEAT